MTIDKAKQIAFEKFGKNITNEQAAKYVEKYGKLSDNELDNVSGGCSADSSVNCPNCGEVSLCVTGHDSGWNSRYRIWTCQICGHTERESY